VDAGWAGEAFGWLPGSEPRVPVDFVTRATFRPPLPEELEEFRLRAGRDAEDACLRLVISVADLWPIVLVHVRYRPSVRVLEFAFRKIDAVPLGNSGVVRSSIRGSCTRLARACLGLRGVQTMHQLRLVNRQTASRNQLFPRGAALGEPDGNLITR